MAAFMIGKYLEPIKHLVDASGGRWKVPGMMTGSNNGMAVYDPEVPVSMDTTTFSPATATFSFFLWMIATPSKSVSLPTGNPI
jgi:hypothetical protein